jgi:hypothetical protein
MFYEVFMKMMEVDGDKERLDFAKQEASKFFGVKFPSPKFRQDNRNILAIPETNEIIQSLNIYKGFGDKISNDMYDLGNSFNGENFLELLIFSEENGRMSSKFEQLIKLNYFSEFGGNKKLLSMFNEFRKGKNKYASKLAEKSKAKRIEMLKIFWEETKNESFSVMEQIANEVGILGRIETKFKDLQKTIGFVIDMDITNSPKIMVQSLRLGNVEQFKIQKKKFAEKEFQIGQLLEFPNGGLIKKQAMRPTGRIQSNGKPEFEAIPDKFEFWIDSYSIVNNI